jgi:hypothetical protein
VAAVPSGLSLAALRINKNYITRIKTSSQKHLCVHSVFKRISLNIHVIKKYY